MKRMAAYMLIIIHFIMVLMFSFDLYADIYSYIDDQGVMHFTNRLTSSTYQSSECKIFIKEKTTGHRKRKSGAAMIGTPSPETFDSIIQHASETHDVAFPLIKAVIKAESNFNPRAVSSVGAKGLMQLMDENLKYYHITNPFDPHENIMGGTRYLKKMLERFEGKMDLALAAYNAGPNAVERYKCIPPYKETRNYVQKVMQFHHDFAKVHENSKTAGIRIAPDIQ